LKITQKGGLLFFLRPEGARSSEFREIRTLFWTRVL
jgi:hypothetical protein